jgi:hypothetical protein
MSKKPISLPEARDRIHMWIAALESPFADNDKVVADMEDVAKRLHRKDKGEKRSPRPLKVTGSVLSEDLREVVRQQELRRSRR